MNEEGGFELGFIPLSHLVVDGLVIPANVLQAQSIFHDVDLGTLTVTFASVRRLETVYAHMAREDLEHDG